MFDEQKVSEEHSEKLWQHYYDTLSTGVDIGYGDLTDSYDAELVQLLKNNIAEFSAFKEASFQQALLDALINENKLPTWEEYKSDALKLHQDYNMRWLETEYRHTIASANFANKWKGFEADADLYPNLKIVTSGDERVRESHRILDGLTLPINHTYWKTHTVPFDWGCRCDIIQSDDQVSTTIPDLNIKSTFAHNPAIDEKIFGDIPYAEGMSEVKVKDIKKKVKKNILNSDYEILKQNSQFNQNLTHVKKYKLDKAFENIDIEKINAVNIYTGSSYERINKWNRGQKLSFLDGEDDKYFQTLTKIINAGLDEIPDRHRGSVFRGSHLQGDIIEKFKESFENGKNIKEQGFTSTSYKQTGLFGGNAKFIINCKDAAKVEKISDHGVIASLNDDMNEYEVLFKSGQEFKINSFLEFEINGKKEYEIIMEQIIN